MGRRILMGRGILMGRRIRMGRWIRMGCRILMGRGIRMGCRILMGRWIVHLVVRDAQQLDSAKAVGHLQPRHHVLVGACDRPCVSEECPRWQLTP